jgi:hypothetical protein
MPYYKAWCEENNVRSQKKQTLFNELNDMEIKIKRIVSEGIYTTYFDGIKML